MKFILCPLFFFAFSCQLSAEQQNPTIPNLIPEVNPSCSNDNERIVVLTFDDSVKSHFTYVAPRLKEYGFGATFFITEGFTFTSDKMLYMTWEEIKSLHDDGFEIGNHTKSHKGVSGQSEDQLVAEIAHIESQCMKYGIPKPVSFCYPAYRTSDLAVKVLKERGYKYARAGGSRAYDSANDNPLLLPQAFDGKPGSTLDQFKEAIAKSEPGKPVILTFHGVPDIQHPWVNTSKKKFVEYMEYLKASGCRVIALRDL
jgi:peptidoglycan/xylan/chitin deacetylase (PgdA/CDA1 family)